MSTSNGGSAIDPMTPASNPFLHPLTGLRRI
jgi:hypothetical protein